MRVGRIKLGGRFEYEVRDRGGILVARRAIDNMVVDEALDHVLDNLLKSGAQLDPWYIGLIDDSGFANLANGDTLASHAGWTEFTDYTGIRKEWVEGAIASGQTDNSASKASFAITAAGTLRGMFIGSVSSGSAGTLLATAVGPSESVDDGYTVEVTYTFAADTQ